jgi:hypothetical protein
MTAAAGEKFWFVVEKAVDVPAELLWVFALVGGIVRDRYLGALGDPEKLK